MDPLDSLDKYFKDQFDSEWHDSETTLIFNNSEIDLTI